MTGNNQDLTHGRFGMLTAKAFAGNHPVGVQQDVPHWKCKCSCGNEVMVSEGELISGTRNSCTTCTQAIENMKH